MLNWLKWLPIGVFITAILVTSLILYTTHNSNTRSVQEVEAALANANIGMMRTEGEATIKKEDAVSQLVAETIETQKNHGNDIVIHYAFLDKAEQQTQSSSDISSVQFKVQLLDNEEVVSESESRLNLKEG